VLDPEQYLVFRRPDEFLSGTPEKAPPSRVTLHIALPTLEVDQAADPDPPDVGADASVSPVAPGPPPQREEGVLDRLIDQLARRAAPRESQGEPPGVTVVEYR
jgi:hypothetical protein